MNDNMRKIYDDDREESLPLWVTRTADRLAILDDCGSSIRGSVPEAVRVLGMLEMNHCPVPLVVILGSGVCLTWKLDSMNAISVTGFDPCCRGRFLSRITLGGKFMTPSWEDCTIVELRNMLYSVFNKR